MYSQFFDISWNINAKMPLYPGDRPFKENQSMSITRGDICNLSGFEMSMHCGTHVDAPLHFINNGKSIIELDLSIFIGKAQVIEVNSVKQVTAAELHLHPIKPGVRLLIKIPRNEVLLDKSEFCYDYIGIDHSAAEFLVEREVPLVGVEYLSIEKTEGDDYPVHHILLGNNVTILEGIDLRKVDPGEYWLACQPLKLENGNGSPVRAILMR